MTPDEVERVVGEIAAAVWARMREKVGISPGAYGVHRRDGKFVRSGNDCLCPIGAVVLGRDWGRPLKDGVRDVAAEILRVDPEFVRGFVAGFDAAFDDLVSVECGIPGVRAGFEVGQRFRGWWLSGFPGERPAVWSRP